MTEPCRKILRPIPRSKALTLEPGPMVLKCTLLTKSTSLYNTGVNVYLTSFNVSIIFLLNAFINLVIIKNQTPCNSIQLFSINVSLLFLFYIFP